MTEAKAVAEGLKVDRIVCHDVETMHIYFDEETILGQLEMLVRSIGDLMPEGLRPFRAINAKSTGDFKDYIELILDAKHHTTVYRALVHGLQPRYVHAGTARCEIIQAPSDTAPTATIYLTTCGEFANSELGDAILVAHVEKVVRHRRKDGLAMICDYNEPAPGDVVETARQVAKALRMYLVNYDDIPVNDTTNSA